jgi:hypothetical protein
VCEAIWKARFNNRWHRNGRRFDNLQRIRTYLVHEGQFLVREGKEHISVVLMNNLRSVLLVFADFIRSESLLGKRGMNINTSRTNLDHDKFECQTPVAIALSIKSSQIDIPNYAILSIETIIDTANSQIHGSQNEQVSRIAGCNSLYISDHLASYADASVYCSDHVDRRFLLRDKGSRTTEGATGKWGCVMNQWRREQSTHPKNGQNGGRRQCFVPL